MQSNGRLYQYGARSDLGVTQWRSSGCIRALCFLVLSLAEVNAGYAQSAAQNAGTDPSSASLPGVRLDARELVIFKQSATSGELPSGIKVQGPWGPEGIANPALKAHLEKMIEGQADGKLIFRGKPDIMQVVEPSGIDDLNGKLGQDILKKPSSACGASANALRITGVPEQLDYADLIAPSSYAKTVLKQLDEFERNCLAPVGKPEYPDTAPDWVKESRPERVLGVLKLRNSDGSNVQTFCTALVLNKKQVLTARHCFYDRRSAIPVAGRLSGIASGLVSFSSALGLDPDVVIAGEAIPQSATAEFLSAGFQEGLPFDAEYDFLVLNLQGEVEGAPAVIFRRAETGEGLWLAGPFAMQFQELPASGSRPHDPHGLRWARDGVCQVAVADDKCVRHTCQTIGSYSGAPVFAKTKIGNADSVTVVGLHLGAVGSGGCAKVDAAVGVAGVGNLALGNDHLQNHVIGWE